MRLDRERLLKRGLIVEQLDAARDGVCGECVRLISAGKKVIVR